MLSFFLLGCIVTAGAMTLFLVGWFNQGQFLFGPFIAAIIGLNFLFISFIQVKREREERERRTS